MSNLTETYLDVDDHRLATLKSTTGRKHRIICVHGWLDNANSFAPLLPLVKDAEVVAIDLPGHGHSSHQQSIYSLAAQAHVVLAAANAMAWEDFTLIGHSLGGCIAPFAAVAAEDRVQKLVLIEAAGPRSEPAESLPQRLVQFHQDMSKPKKYQSRMFDSIDQAVESRLRANRMLPQSARMIVERQLQEINHDGEQKWQWRFDHKLRVASPSYFTEEQVTSVLSAITCPVLCILADEGYLTDRKETDYRLNCIDDLDVTTIKGHHHLHLDTPQPVADAINHFLS